MHSNKIRQILDVVLTMQSDMDMLQKTDNDVTRWVDEHYVLLTNDVGRDLDVLFEHVEHLKATYYEVLP